MIWTALGRKGIHHYAFHLDNKQFQEVFARIKTEGIPYGDNYAEPANMRGPGTAPGARGSGRSIYFKDPSGNLLQIITYLASPFETDSSMMTRSFPKIEFD